jgi:hypothetical protein
VGAIAVRWSDTILTDTDYDGWSDVHEYHTDFDGYLDTVAA